MCLYICVYFCVFVCLYVGVYMNERDWKTDGGGLIQPRAKGWGTNYGLVWTQSNELNITVHLYYKQQNHLILSNVVTTNNIHDFLTCVVTDLTLLPTFRLPILLLLLPHATSENTCHLHRCRMTFRSLLVCIKWNSQFNISFNSCSIRTYKIYTPKASPSPACWINCPWLRNCRFCNGR